MPANDLLFEMVAACVAEKQNINALNYRITEECKQWVE